MRQSTPLLDLEHDGIYRPRESLRRARQQCPVEFRGVDVYALGVDASGVSFAYWSALKDFWLEYLKQAGANVREYSILREVPN